MPKFRIIDNQRGIQVIVTYRDQTLLQVELARIASKYGLYKHISAPERRFERKLAKDFQSYFSGKNVTFDYNLSLENLTPFQRNVLERLRKIPFGSVESYKSVAKKTGRPKAYRAVGSACGKNPFPIIIPCHRVVKTDGSLGGFGSGIDIKEILLKLEWIEHNQIKTLTTRKRMKK